MAEAHAKALLDGVSDSELAELVDEKPKLRKRLNRALDWARRVPEMEATVTELADRIESGRIELAHSPLRVKQAISMLDGSRRTSWSLASVSSPQVNMLFRGSWT